MPDYLIGIDVGTSSTKTVLASPEGEVLARASADYALRSPGISRSEQDALDWWRALVSTVREVCASLPAGGKVAALSLSTQGGTLVPVGADHSPLRPAIVWNDVRCGLERAEYEKDPGEAHMYSQSGWQLGNGLNALQIAWLRRNEPDVFQKAAWFLSVPDYLSLRLTGQPVADISNAGICQLTDIRSAGYDARTLQFCGIEKSRLPRVLPSGVPVGRLAPDAARELGLSRDVLLVTGAHDQYAALLGAGVAHAGSVLIGTGTAWVVTALSDAPDFASGFSQSVSAVPGMWGSLVSLPAGGVCLEWLRSSVAGTGAPEETLPFARLDAEAAARRAAEDGLFFFPYFTGASFPLQGNGGASFTGLDLSHDRFHMARAVMEGIAFHTAWVLEHFRERYGAGDVRLSGGAAKSALWTGMLANITGQSISLPTWEDLPCVGAAILAGIGCGAIPDTREGCRRFTAGRLRQVSPQPGQAAVFRGLLEAWKRQAARLWTHREPAPAGTPPGNK